MTQETSTREASGDIRRAWRWRPSVNVGLFATCFVLLFAKVVLARWIALDSVGPLRAVLFEAAFLLAVLGAVEMFASRRVVAYLVVDVAVSVLLAATVVYGSYFDRVLTPAIFRFAGQLGDVSASIADLFKPLYLVFFADILIVALAMPYLRKREEWWRLDAIDSRIIGVATASLLVAVGLAWTLVGRTASGDSIAIAREKGLIRYQLAAVFKGPGDTILNDVDTSDPAAVKAAVDEVKGPLSAKYEFEQHGVGAGKNLIVIQLESIQAFSVGIEVGGSPVTPNMDKLAEEGWYFPNTYFQAGLGNTSDVEFMMNTSLYPRADLSAGEASRGRIMPGLPRILEAQGYRSVAFHANEVAYWDRDVMYPALGFDEFYDVEYIGSNDVVGLGASDEVLFEKAMPVLEEAYDAETPFFAMFITLTPHHPFDIPAAKRRLELPGHFEGTVAGKYLQCVNYEDWCVGQFVEDLKRIGAYEDSVIVIYGDHFGMDPKRMTDEDSAVLEEILGRPYALTDKFNVPFLIHVPGVAGTTVERTVGQMDMMPTAADIMGLDLSAHVRFGTSA
ncbi:MAG: LTA synthase family protein, partial [Coriobacteriia bacterium]|nr:LTA synthase family protein [Coriobacteriia bacterium]